MSACPKPGRPFRISRWRRTTQAFLAVLFIVTPLASARGFSWISGTLGSLQIGPLDLVEPAGAVSAVLAAGRITAALAVGTGPLLLLAVILGPVFCSWACPWGLLSEAISGIRTRLQRRAWKRAEPVARTRLLTLALLFGLSLLLANPIAAFVSGPRLITTLPLEAIHLRHVSSVTGLLLLALLALEMMGPRRLWCRALCPAGALIRLLRMPRTLAPIYDAQRCANPRVALCLVQCPWALDPRTLRLSDGCTSCMACLDACGAGALGAGFGARQPVEIGQLASEVHHG